MIHLFFLKCCVVIFYGFTYSINGLSFDDFVRAIGCCWFSHVESGNGGTWRICSAIHGEKLGTSTPILDLL
jgi:hypothetical protein